MSKNLSTIAIEQMHTKNQNIFDFKLLKKINWMKGLRIIFASSAILSKCCIWLMGTKTPLVMEIIEGISVKAHIAKMINVCAASDTLVSLQCIDPCLQAGFLYNCKSREHLWQTWILKMLRNCSRGQK